MKSTIGVLVDSIGFQRHTILRQSALGVGIFFLLSFLASPAGAANRFWVATTTTAFNSTAGWSASSGGASGASAPVAGDTAIFDGGGGTKNGNCTISAAVDVSGAGGISISGYTGTITDTSSSITVGSGGFSQTTGTFTAGSGTTSVASLSITGGAFTSTSGTLTVTGNTFTHSGGTFTHNSGTVTFTGTPTVTVTTATAFSTVNFSGTGSGSITGAGGLTAATANFTAGTIAQSTTTPITVTGTLTVSGGTFSGGSGTISVGTLSLTSGTFTSTSGTLTVTGATFTHSTGGTFTHNSGTVTFTGASPALNLSVATTFNNVNFSGSGTAALTNGLTAAGDVNINSPVNQASSVAFQYSGTLTVNTGGTYTNASSGSFTGSAPGGALNVAGGTFTMGGSSTFTVTSLAISAGTFNVAGSTSPNINGDLSVSGTGKFSGNTGVTEIIKVTGSVNVSGGTFDLSTGSGVSLTVTGSVTVSGGTFTGGTGANNIFSAGSITVQDAGSFTANTPVGASFSAGSITVSVAGHSGGTFNVLSTSPAIQVTGGGSFTVNSGGTVVLNGASTVTGTGSFTLNSGGNLQIGSTAGIASSGSTGNVQMTTRAFGSGANYTYIGTATQITGTGLPTSLTGSLTINDTPNTTTTTLTNTSTSVGSLTVTSGNFIVSGTGGATSGSLTVTGATSVAASNGTLTVAGSGATTGTLNANGSTTINGTLTVAAAGTGTVNAAGDFSAPSGSTVKQTGGIANVVFSGSGTQNYTGGGTLSGPLNYSVGGSSFLALQTSLTLPASSSLTIAAGGTFDQGCSNSLNLNSGGAGGAFSISGSYTNCAANIAASGNLTSGAITVNSGGRFSYIGTGTVTLSGDLSNSGTVQLWGGSPQIGGQRPACPSTNVTLTSSVQNTSNRRSWSGSGTFILENINVSYQTTPTSSSPPTLACYGCTNNTGNANLWSAAGTYKACGAVGQPTLVSFHSFSATPQDGGILLQWQTGREVDNLGFYVYRDGVRLTLSPVAGSALLAGPGTVLTAGNSYSWFDAQGTSSSSYTIEDLGLNGIKSVNGPFHVEGAAASTTVLNRLARGGGTMASAALSGGGGGRSMLLSEVGRTVGNPSYLTTVVETRAPTPPARLAGTSQQYTLAAGQAVKLGIQHEGWYHVDASQLTAAGMPGGALPSSLRLFVNGLEQDISVLTSSGQVSAIEFYGMGLDTIWSDTQVYWLTWGAQSGQRIASYSAKGHGSPPASFPAAVQWKPRTLYFPALINGDADNFFGPALNASDPVTQPVNLTNLLPGVAGSSTLQVTMQGVTAGAHVVGVQLNGSSLGSMTFNNQANSVSNFTVPNASLVAGANTLALSAQGGPGDVTVVDTVLLSYPHSYTADSDYLRFTAPAGPQVTITGFSNSQIRVMDITDPANVIALQGTVTAQAGGYSISVAPQDPRTHTLLAFTDAQVSQPLTVAANHPSSWHSPQAGADMVIISHGDFVSSLGPLQALRQSQGRKVAVMDVADLYDEFNFGDQSPYAVKTFLSTASTAWKTKPRWVLLVGDATYDPRNYLGTGQVDYLPVELVGTSQLETASDDWFVDFNNDGSPEMAIGRLPVHAASDAAALVNKIVAYDQAGTAVWKNNALLVSGANDSDNNFESYTAAVQGLLPAGMTVTKILEASDPNPSFDIPAAFNSGQGLVNYAGHGSTEIWQNYMFTSAAASGVSNGSATPLVLSMTCLNGYFQDLFTFSLAEAVLEAPGGGAVAVWASSGLTDSAPQSTLNQAMITNLYGGLTVGEAAVAAKKVVSDPDVRKTWLLFGDPAMKLR